MNDQRLTNLYEIVVFRIQHPLVLFSGTLKPQAGSFKQVETRVDFVISDISSIFNDSLLIIIFA